MATLKAQKIERQEMVLADLREMYPVGTVVPVILRHVSRSGMSRAISVMSPDRSQDMSYLIERAGLFKLHSRYQGLTVGGCGMDMGFHVVYSLSRTLHRGWACSGQDDCPSNDHVNARPVEGQSWGDARRASFVAGLAHSDAGYALGHRWL